MQKYIAVVNPSMDADEISNLITQGVAGAVFAISHGNFHDAARLVEQTKSLSQKFNRPISIIQDLSNSDHDVDAEFGQRMGVNFVTTDKPHHAKLVKGLNKLAGVIFKGRNLPKERVDSVMGDSFLDPDAKVLGDDSAQIKHLVTDHSKQAILDSILDVAHHAGSQSIAVSDLDLAKALSMRRPNQRVIFAPEDPDMAPYASIYWGVHPLYPGPDLLSNMQHNKLTRKGDRVTDATDPSHVVIHLVG